MPCPLSSSLPAASIDGLAAVTVQVPRIPPSLLQPSPVQSSRKHTDRRAIDQSPTSVWTGRMIVVGRLLLGSSRGGRSWAAEARLGCAFVEPRDDQLGRGCVGCVRLVHLGGRVPALERPTAGPRRSAAPSPRCHRCAGSACTGSSAEVVRARGSRSSSPSRPRRVDPLLPLSGIRSSAPGDRSGFLRRGVQARPDRRCGSARGAARLFLAPPRRAGHG